MGMGTTLLMRCHCRVATFLLEFHADPKAKVDGTSRNTDYQCSRYPFSGMIFPNFRPWIEKVICISINNRVPLCAAKAQDPPIRNEPLIADLQACLKAVSFTDEGRLLHGHGHTCQEVYTLRFGKLRRIPHAVAVEPRRGRGRRQARQAAQGLPHLLRRRQLRLGRARVPRGRAPHDG